MFFVANVAEKQLGSADSDPHVTALRAHAEKQGAPVVPICAAAEAEIAGLDEADRPAFLESLGLKEPGLHAVARTAYNILDLITFLTAGEDECRAWTIKRGAKAPQAAGAIHTDFERGFIKAEVIWWEDLIKLGSEAACRRSRQAERRRQGLRRPRRRRDPLQVQRLRERMSIRAGRVLGLVVALGIAGQARAVDDYTLGPDSLPQPGVPAGAIHKFQFASSRFFPGTQRDYWVYVPAQYRPAVPPA